MSVRASTWAWQQPVGLGRKLVLLALADAANDADECFPGQTTLAQKCGISERALRDHLAGLAASGYIKRQRRRRDSGSRSSDLYTLALPAGFAGNQPADPAAVTGRSRPNLPADSAPRINRKKNRKEESCRACSPHVVFLCRLLADLITARDPKAKTTPDGDRWLADMRLLVERDERSVIDVERVIRWCQGDGFWAPNILSPGKLRDKFPVLWGQMNRPHAGKPSGEPGAHPSESSKVVSLRSGREPYYDRALR